LTPTVLLVALVVAATWKLTFGQRIIARGDLLLYFYPLRDYASQAIRELRLPLWNPYTFMGSPFLANSQVGFFYPFNILTAWLPVAQAVSWQIALHLLIAALGTYALARQGLKVGRLAGACAAVAFGLGGYLGAQVEHLNQLQVLAWLPLLVFAISDFGFSVDGWRVWLRRGLIIAGIVALMITAGHTQSLYISLVTCGVVIAIQFVVVVAPSATSRWLTIQSPLRGLMRFGVGVCLAALICAVQLLPTLELSRESARAGGLPFGEAASFSWRPWVISRALMPTYGDPLFPEYVTYFGAAGMALAVLGALARGTWHMAHGEITPAANSQRLIPFVLVLVGFILALGVVTPVFNALYKFLPGFNLFRAQARWLAVFALGMSLLVGLGVQRLRDGITSQQARTWLMVWVGVMALWAIGLVVGTRISLDPEYKTLPARSVLVGWAIAALVATTLAVIVWRMKRSLHPPLSTLFVLALCVELLVASQFQPYSRASDAQSLTELRPSVAYVLGEQRGPLPSLARTGDRVLALSSLFFDPGDKPEQELIYGPQLTADEVYDRIIATKHKEVLSPNLPLYYRIPSVDGYDGGLLPTRRYAEYVKQFAQTPTGSVDGRLREFLKGVPANMWLTQMSVRYLIADKTQDVFVNGVYYDLLFSATITDVFVQHLVPFESDAVGLVLDPTSTATRVNGIIAASNTDQIRFDVPVTIDPITGLPHARITLNKRASPLSLVINDPRDDATLILRGITTIDEANKTFLSQHIVGTHNMRLVHSGDVKIYENMRPAPRVEIGAGSASIIEESPEHITVAISTTAATQLILRDTCFPGWVAQVDEAETPITCTDTVFRRIDIPANARAREVTFRYEPQLVRVGVWISATGLGLVSALAIAAVRKEKRGQQ
jgi:hypothetical protein